jgi:hypothetical protein
LGRGVFFDYNINLNGAGTALGRHGYPCGALNNFPNVKRGNTYTLFTSLRREEYFVIMLRERDLYPIRPIATE